MFDISGLGDWGDLPFFAEDLPTISQKIGAEVLPPPARTFAALERVFHHTEHRPNGQVSCPPTAGATIPQNPLTGSSDARPEGEST